jgi:catechol 2,3-dioxygenase-like lactoylglutathione lyase family enzyme
MKHSHVHFGVRDLAASVKWFEAVLALPAAFQNEKMAMIPSGEFSIILDAADTETRATLAFDSEDCERDFQSATARGAQVIAAPARTPWGVISAYLKGPGDLIVEIEQKPEKANG